MKRRPYILSVGSDDGSVPIPAGPLAITSQAIGRAFLPADAVSTEPAPMIPGKVAVVSISGPLFQHGFESIFGCIEGYDSIEARFAAALEHPQVGAVVLVIDSPGGATAGMCETARRMREARDRAGKPVFAFANEQIASAAYALATVANGGIYLPRSGEVGSIGVLMIHAELSGAHEKDGVSFNIIRSGPRKMEVNDVEPLNDVARGAMQARVDALALQFFELVGEARGLTPEQVAAFGGAMFSGPQAVECGLANEIATLETVLTMAADAASGAGMSMSEEEKKKMEALEATVAELKAKLEKSDEKSEDEEAEDETEEDTADGDTEEEDPKKEEASTGSGSSVANLKAEVAAQDVKDVIDAAGRAGKVPPAGRAALFEEGLRIGSDALAKKIDAMATKVSTRRIAPKVDPLSVLTEEDRRVASMLNIPLDQYAASKAADMKETA